jgi:hypothetical protein
MTGEQAIEFAHQFSQGQRPSVGVVERAADLEKLLTMYEGQM